MAMLSCRAVHHVLLYLKDASVDSFFSIITGEKNWLKVIENYERRKKIDHYKVKCILTYIHTSHIHNLKLLPYIRTFINTRSEILMQITHTASCI